MNSKVTAMHGHYQHPKKGITFNYRKVFCWLVGLMAIIYCVLTLCGNKSDEQFGRKESSVTVPTHPRGWSGARSVQVYVATECSGMCVPVYPVCACMCRIFRVILKGFLKPRFPHIGTSIIKIH